MSYDLEPHSNDPEEPVLPPKKSADGAQADEAGHDDEAGEAAAPAVIQLRGDSCPSCGATLHEEGAQRCLRCGWDDRAEEPGSKRPAATQGDRHKGGESASSDSADADGDAAPLVRPHATDRWLPAALAGAALLTIVIGLLAGAAGLFPHPLEGEVTVIAWPERLALLGRLPVYLLVWTACGVGSLFVLAWLEVRPLGDLRAAALRLAAAVAVARCATWIRVPWSMAEFLLEAALEAAIYFALVMLLFRFRPRPAAIVVAVTVGAFFLSLIMARLITWAI